MARTIAKQRGITFLSVLIGVAILVSVVTLLLRLGPHYIDWQMMKSVFGDLPAAQVHTMSREDLRESLKKRFKVNSLRDFELREILTIEREKGVTTLMVEYERREPIVANVDVVLSFSEQYQFK